MEKGGLALCIVYIGLQQAADSKNSVYMPLMTS